MGGAYKVCCPSVVSYVALYHDARALGVISTGLGCCCSAKPVSVCGSPMLDVVILHSRSFCGFGGNRNSYGFFFMYYIRFGEENC